MREFYNKNFSNWKKIMRFILILFLPFGYSFLYIFGFNNQFSNINKLDVRVIVEKDDEFATAFSKQLKSMTQPIKLGNLSFKVNINHNAPTNEIYLDTHNKNDFDTAAKHNANKAYATLAISPNITKFIGNNTYNMIENLNVLNAGELIQNLLNDIKNANLFTFYLNYNGSPAASLGISIATTMTPIYIRALMGLFNTSPTSIINVSSGKKDFSSYKNKINNIWDSAKKLTSNDVINQGFLNNFSFVETHSNIPNNGNLAWIIAPFFIIIGMWMGGITLMLLIPMNISKQTKAIKNYFQNAVILLAISTIQATILILSLYIFGFASFGINMLSLFITTIIISAPLIILIQGIRFIIPHKIFAILLLLILLLVQMSMIGGLFGVHTTNSVYRIVSYILPITYAMKLINMSLYSFTWLGFIINLTYLYLISVVIVAPCIFLYIKQYGKRRNELLKHNV